MTTFFQHRKTRSKAGLGALQPFSGFLSCQTLLCQESRQQDLPAPLRCHQTHLELLLFKTVSGRTRWASTNQMHISGIPHVNCSRSKVSPDASNLGKTTDCTQSSDNISLSFFVVLKNRGKYFAPR